MHTSSLLLAKTFQRLRERMSKLERPSVGIALGSGAARGLAHIGVLEALENAEIPIDVITGSSMGAVIGAMYAAGISTSTMRRLVNSISKIQLLSWTDITLPRRGIISGKKIEDFLRSILGRRSFDDTKIPLAVCATEIMKGIEVAIEEGQLAEAVRASISIPGIFVPYQCDGQTLVDGGIINPVPVDYLKIIGVDITIAVDVIPRVERKAISNPTAIDILLNSFDIMERRIFEAREGDAMVTIRPNVDEVEGVEFWKACSIIEHGLEAGKRAVPKIAALMDSPLAMTRN